MWGRTPLLDRLQALRGALPKPIEQKEIAIPHEVPGYGDYLRFGVDRWRQVGPGIYTDGQYALVWAPLDPDHALLFWGDRAEALVSVREGR